MEPLLTHSSDLDIFLLRAKRAQEKWDEWENKCSRNEISKQLYQDKRDAWAALYRLIHRSSIYGPLRFITLDSETINVGTVGMMTSEQLLYYSLEANAKWTLSEICLRTVQSIKLV